MGIWIVGSGEVEVEGRSRVVVAIVVVSLGANMKVVVLGNVVVEPLTWRIGVWVTVGFVYVVKPVLVVVVSVGIGRCSVVAGGGGVVVGSLCCDAPHAAGKTPAVAIAPSAITRTATWILAMIAPLERCPMV